MNVFECDGTDTIALYYSTMKSHAFNGVSFYIIVEYPCFIKSNDKN